MHPRQPHRSGKISSRASLRNDPETLHRVEEIPHAEGGDKSHVGLVRPDESRDIALEAAASAIGKVGIENRLSGLRHGLHHLVPEFHLVDDIAVGWRTGIAGHDFLHLFGTSSHLRVKLHIGEFPGKGTCDLFHRGGEVVSDIGPGPRSGVDRSGERIEECNLQLFLTGIGSRKGRHEGGRAQGHAGCTGGRKEPSPG